MHITVDTNNDAATLAAIHLDSCTAMCVRACVRSSGRVVVVRLFVRSFVRSSVRSSVRLFEVCWRQQTKTVAALHATRVSMMDVEATTVAHSRLPVLGLRVRTQCFCVVVTPVPVHHCWRNRFRSYAPYHAEPTGDFQCAGDTQLTKIWSIGAASTRSCVEDTCIDGACACVCACVFMRLCVACARVSVSVECYEAVHVRRRCRRRCLLLRTWSAQIVFRVRLSCVCFVRFVCFMCMVCGGTSRALAFSGPCRERGQWTGDTLAVSLPNLIAM